MDRRVYWIWMQKALGPGSPLSGKLMALFPDVTELYDASRDALKRAGVGGKPLERLCDKDTADAEAVLASALKEDGWVLTPDDDYYPSLLRGIYALPTVLYGRGTMPDLDRFPAVAVAGTRHMSGYGREMAATLGAGLAAGGMVVVTGGSLGIEAVAARSALEHGGVTVVIQATPLDRSYPLPNEPLRREVLQSGGVLLSECPPGAASRPLFTLRNRLISGVSWGVCAVEAPAGSGSLSIARYAVEQGRDVFAVPGPATAPLSAGTNRLIQEGAKLVYGVADILVEYENRFPAVLNTQAGTEAEQRLRREMQRKVEPEEPPLLVADFVTEKERPKAAPKKPPASETAPEVPAPEAVCPDTVSGTARQVWMHLTGTLCPIDELAKAAEMPTATVLAALTELEIAGCVRSGAGQAYSRK